MAGREVGARALNQFRLYAALPMLGALGFASCGAVWPTDVSTERMVLLGLSGLIGLVIGDFCFFHALATIGPRLAPVIMALWPGCTVAIDAARGEAPSNAELVGVALTVVGVTIVLARSRGGSWRTDLTRGQWLIGCVGAVIGAIGQAGGFVMAGVAMAPGPDLSGGVDPLLATIVRMVAATVGMQVAVLVQRRPLAMVRVIRKPKALAAGLLGALCGPVLGVWMSMVARAHASNAGVAAALMVTTPVWMLPVSIWYYRARVGPAGLFGTLLAVAGVAVCFLGVGWQ